MKSWDERAQGILAQGCVTYSKRSDQFVKGIYPTHITHGDSCYVYTPGGGKFLDFIGGLGSTIVDNCNNYCLPTIDEVLLAEKVRSLVPCCEKLRFLKTGSEADQAAVRIARAYKEATGSLKESVKGCGHGYFGWHNWTVAALQPGAGTVDELFERSDDLLQAVASGEFGYCIVEPVQLDISDERRSFLQQLRDVCDKTATVLIFDEVITGFRVPRYTIAEYWKIAPDIITLGKAMGNGYPIAIVGGKKEIMDTEGWFVSSTFAGEAASIKAALETIDVLTPAVLNQLWEAGERFQCAFNEISPILQLVGLPTKMVYKGDDMVKALFWQEMCRRGIITGKALHVTVAHVYGKKLDVFLGQAQLVLPMIERGEVVLEGDMPTEIFRRY